MTPRDCLRMARFVALSVLTFLLGMGFVETAGPLPRRLAVGLLRSAAGSETGLSMALIVTPFLRSHLVWIGGPPAPFGSGGIGFPFLIRHP